MKYAILSDVHGNLPALHAVLEDIDTWQADTVIVNGDLINRGPYSVAAMQLLDEHWPSAHILKGNHENFVLNSATRPVDPGHHLFELYRFSEWTARQLDEQHLATVAGWPTCLDIDDPDCAGSVHITHGSRRGDRDGISPGTSDAELPDKLGDATDLFIASHTHVAMRRVFDGRLIINTGSVGQPLDNDPRASYARISDSAAGWQAEIRRVPYDKQQAARDFHDSGFMAAGGLMAQLIYLEHEQNRKYVGPFMHRYLHRIEAGEISFRAAFDDYLD